MLFRSYKTNYAFPLLYWQDNYISKKDYQSLSPTEKERVLATGVLVDKQAKLRGMKAAKLKTHVYPLKSELVSNRLNKVNPANLTYTDSEETYQLQLPELQSKKMQQKLKGSELHIEFSKIKYTPFSMKEQIAYEQAHLKETVLNPGNVINQRYTHYRYWRYHVLNGSPDISFKLNIGSKFGTATIEQARQSTLSLFKHVTNSTLNIGYYDGKLPTSLTFQPSKLGTYKLKYRVVAEKLDNNYYREIKTLQRHRLEDVKFKRNQVQGTIKTTRPGVLTSSIPYSTGWSVKVNGKKATTLRTNQAFLGVYLPAGTHHVTFSYELPGIKLGALLSLIGLGWTIFAGIITIGWERKQR